MLGEILSFTALAFGAIFFVVDPIGVVPVFLSITADDSQRKRAEMARRACIFSSIILIFFALGGGILFKVLGLTIAAFKVAGGILLLLTALDMLRSKTSQTKTSGEELAESATKDDIAIVPLGMPLLAGPGSIATVMVLTSKSTHAWELVPIIGSIVVTFSIAYFLLRGADWIDRRLGRSGRAILERVMGLLLAAIAVQFILDGIREAFPGMMAT